MKIRLDLRNRLVNSENKNIYTSKNLSGSNFKTNKIINLFEKIYIDKKSILVKLILTFT